MSPEMIIVWLCAVVLSSIILTTAFFVCGWFIREARYEIKEFVEQRSVGEDAS